MHQLTDLPDDPAEIAAYAARNGRIRREGTRNLLAAAAAAGTRRFIAQLPEPPRIHVDDAARATVPVLEAPAGLTVVADDRAA